MLSGKEFWANTGTAFMTRIFLTLASVNGMALIATFLLGVTSFLRRGVENPLDPVYQVHFLAGLITAILTLLVHCIIFTYFLGTGRWVKEVGLAYALPDEPWPKLTRELKRATFPPALFAMLITIATAAAGTAAQLRAWDWWVHGGLALATLLINGWAFTVEYHNVRTNAGVIEAVLRDVDRIRGERGLPPNADALMEDGA
jgi:hypothetical protein